MNLNLNSEIESWYICVTDVNSQVSDPVEQELSLEADLYFDQKQEIQLDSYMINREERVSQFIPC